MGEYFTSFSASIQISPEALKCMGNFPEAMCCAGGMIHSHNKQHILQVCKRRMVTSATVAAMLRADFLTLSLTKPTNTAWRALVMQHAILVSPPDQCPRGFEPRPVTCIHNALSMSHGVILILIGESPSLVIPSSEESLRRGHVSLRAVTS